jgi:hypothetical protein
LQIHAFGGQRSARPTNFNPFVCHLDNPENNGIMQKTNFLGRARHSVRAACCKTPRSAGRGLPALPILTHLFVIYIVPENKLKNMLTKSDSFDSVEEFQQQSTRKDSK